MSDGPGPREPQRAVRPAAVRIAILFGGWVFLILGVLGLFLPLLQGILFTAVGLYLLSLESRWVHERVERLRARSARFSHAMDRVHGWAERLSRWMRGTS